MRENPMVRLAPVAAQRWGLLTTAVAAEVGVSRQQLWSLVDRGLLVRVAQGVYRLAGAPESEHEMTYAMWLALGGDRVVGSGVPAVVAAGSTATTLHGLGDFYQDGYDFLVPSRRVTRLPGVRLRVRPLRLDEVMVLDGIPALRVERLLADLVDQWVDLSLVAGVLADAVRQGSLLAPGQLVSHLDARTRRHGFADGAEMAAELYTLAGLPSGGDH